MMHYWRYPVTVTIVKGFTASRKLMKSLEQLLLIQSASVLSIPTSCFVSGRNGITYSDSVTRFCSAKRDFMSFDGNFLFHGMRTRDFDQYGISMGSV